MESKTLKRQENRKQKKKIEQKTQNLLKLRTDKIKYGKQRKQ